MSLYYVLLRAWLQLGQSPFFIRSLSVAISAASILAKTYRDAMMEALDVCYPGFELATHKGYCTPAHLQALRG